MSFSTFFTNQARKPEGLFGRLIMRWVFDRGNAFLNRFALETMDVQPDDRILEIGSGTGKLIHKMAGRMEHGFVEGIDFSQTMTEIARKRNRQHIATGKVRLVEGNFDSMPYEEETFSKACSVNTIYFWPGPQDTAKKLVSVLETGGKCILAFEDIAQLKQRQLDWEVFRPYSTEEIRKLLKEAGFSSNVRVESRKKERFLFHCVIAEK